MYICTCIYKYILVCVHAFNLSPSHLLNKMCCNINTHTHTYINSLVIENLITSVDEYAS